MLKRSKSAFKGVTLLNHARIVAMIQKEPCTYQKISEALEVAPQTVAVFIEALHACGLVYCCGKERFGRLVFKWQPAPFTYADIYQVPLTFTETIETKHGNRKSNTANQALD